jgi:thiol-disulfide isomerase/thioredoxin
MNEAAAVAARRAPRRLPLLFFLILAVIAALIALLAYGVRQRSAPPLATGQAPIFSLTTFDGQHLSSADLKGKPVVVNFWASWCVPCRDEAPLLQRAWEQYRERGLVVVGVDYVDTEPEARNSGKRIRTGLTSAHAFRKRITFRACRRPTLSAATGVCCRGLIRKATPMATGSVLCPMSG